jgi:hypothetical protein
MQRDNDRLTDNLDTEHDIRQDPMPRSLLVLVASILQITSSGFDQVYWNKLPVSQNIESLSLQSKLNHS